MRPFANGMMVVLLACAVGVGVGWHLRGGCVVTRTDRALRAEARYYEAVADSARVAADEWRRLVRADSLFVEELRQRTVRAEQAARVQAVRLRAALDGLRHAQTRDDDEADRMLIHRVDSLLLHRVGTGSLRLAGACVPVR